MRVCHQEVDLPIEFTRGFIKELRIHIPYALFHRPKPLQRIRELSRHKPAPRSTRTMQHRSCSGTHATCNVPRSTHCVRESPAVAPDALVCACLTVAVAHLQRRHIRVFGDCRRSVVMRAVVSLRYRQSGSGSAWCALSDALGQRWSQIHDDRLGAGAHRRRHGRSHCSRAPPGANAESPCPPAATPNRPPHAPLCCPR